MDAEEVAKRLRIAANIARICAELLDKGRISSEEVEQDLRSMERQIEAARMAIPSAEWSR